MFALLLYRGNGSEQCIRFGADRGANLDQSRLALRQRAGFIDDHQVDLFEALDSLGIFHEDAHLRPAPDSDHDRHRRGQTERARARDDEDSDGINYRVRETRFRPDHEPQRKGQSRGP
jgi:hypothetical protein